MYARTKLAAMDHNSGVDQKQARTKGGNLLFKTIYSRITPAWVAQNIMERKNKTFLYDILDAIWVIGFEQKSVTSNLEDIPDNIAKVPNPGKHIIIDSHTLRF